MQYEYILAGDTKEIDDKRICSIEDTSILSTDGEGNITGLKPGTTKMYVDLYSNFDLPTQEYTVIVLDKSEFDFYNSDYFLHYGETYTITNNPNVQLYACDTEQLEIIGNNKIKPLVFDCFVSVNVYYCGKFLKTLEYYVHQELVIVDKPVNNHINVGQRYEELSTVWYPSNTWREAEWSSSDESIAEVYFDMVKGYVVLIGKSEGVVTIFAEVPGGFGSASFVLTVGNLEIEKIELELLNGLEDSTLYFGETGSVKARVYPQNYEQHYFEYIDWKTSNNEILFLRSRANNKYVADAVDVCPGTVNIWAEIGDSSSAKIPITVKEPKAKITNKPSNNTLYKGSTHTLDYVSDPSDATIIWDSDNVAIAEVDANGKITAKAPGTVQISIIVKYGSYKHMTDSFALIVKDAQVTINANGKDTLVVGEKTT